MMIVPANPLNYRSAAFLPASLSTVPAHEFFGYHLSMILA
jgi:hypothetical protein